MEYFFILEKIQGQVKEQRHPSIKMLPGNLLKIMDYQVLEKLNLFVPKVISGPFGGQRIKYPNPMYFLS
jgi:hypothetical protein